MKDLLESINIQITVNIVYLVSIWERGRNLIFMGVLANFCIRSCEDHRFIDSWKASLSKNLD